MCTAILCAWLTSHNRRVPNVPDARLQMPVLQVLQCVGCGRSCWRRLVSWLWRKQTAGSAQSPPLPPPPLLLLPARRAMQGNRQLPLPTRLVTLGPHTPEVDAAPDNGQARGSKEVLCGCQLRVRTVVRVLPGTTRTTAMA